MALERRDLAAKHRGVGIAVVVHAPAARSSEGSSVMSNALQVWMASVDGIAGVEGLIARWSGVWLAASMRGRRAACALHTAMGDGSGSATILRHDPVNYCTNVTIRSMRLLTSGRMRCPHPPGNRLRARQHPPPPHRQGRSRAPGLVPGWQP